MVGIRTYNELINLLSVHGDHDLISDCHRNNIHGKCIFVYVKLIDVKLAVDVPLTVHRLMLGCVGLPSSWADVFYYCFIFNSIAQKVITPM